MREESMPTTVGIRELKARLSSYMDQVKAGATVTVTERGKPVGRIVPVRPALEDKLHQLAQEGTLSWSGRKLGPRAPSIRPRGERSVSELLVEDRG
jgi:prevent-host-death family protein